MQLVAGELIHPITGVRIDRLAISGPPRHGKTTVVGEHGIPWYLGRHPDRTVIHLTSSHPLAASYDAAISSTLETNEKHRAVFPECEPWPKKGWNSLDGRYLTANSGKDPSFKAYGVGAKILGAGADLIVMDDCVDQEAERSEVILAQLKDDYDGTISNRVNPGGVQCYIGHRWGLNDFLEHLVQNWDFAWLNLPALTEA